MVKEHDLRVCDTGFQFQKCVSYVQLGRILESIDYKAFNRINNQYFEVQAEQIEGNSCVEYRIGGLYPVKASLIRQKMASLWYSNTCGYLS